MPQQVQENLSPPYTGGEWDRFIFCCVNVFSKIEDLIFFVVFVFPENIVLLWHFFFFFFVIIFHRKSKQMNKETKNLKV